MAGEILIRDLIHVPEQVNQGDFVLNLSEGVNDVETTLGQYVVTDQLCEAFDQALTYIRMAVEGRSSRASYLHGSFGAGKSHFMAVLHLLLKGDPRARSVTDLAPVVAKHEWLGGKRFLLVPFHMIGASSVESAVFGGYVRHMQRVHPGEPLPPLFLAESIFNNAKVLREQMGDEAFFRSLNKAAGPVRDKDEDRWGDIDARWGPTSFEAALQAPLRLEAEATEEHRGDEIGPRGQLVVDLVATLLPAYHNLAESKAESYVSLDEGLSIIARHAQGLGNDAVVLFLDELILWLATHAADLKFLQTEGPKLVNLVEFKYSRPIPVVSFVARQRDLRELVGKDLSGAEALNFADILDYWEGRFGKISLTDRDLPKIAQGRLLKPKDKDAGRAIDLAFAETIKVRTDVMDTLLTSEATKEMFRLVYPFSPALVQALVAVSSALQRERTALKIMLQILVDQRDTLRLGDLVPVGDLWDVVAEGGERFSESLIRTQFEMARKLYDNKLRPMLEDQYQVNLEHALEHPSVDPEIKKKLAAFHNDARLIKTLLLAALVPEVESLRALTAAKLAALNHGTIRSPVPGREASIVLNKVKQWAGQVGEIRLEGDPNNPTIALHLSGVDVKSVLDRAASHDNASNKKTKVRDLLFKALDIGGLETLRHYEFDMTWRGTERQVDVVYANVRDLPDDSLRCEGPTWRLILDYPFDSAGHTPTEDLDRLDQFRQREKEASKTLVWLPSFFSLRSQRDLGTLVVLDHILSGENFGRYADHLQPADRPVALEVLRSQRSALAIKVLQLLEAAYGIRPADPGTLDQSHDLADHFQSLDGTFKPRPPTGATLGEGLRKLVEQALAHQYPAHPEFPELVRNADLKVVLEHVRRAAADPASRTFVEKQGERRLMERVAVPLKLGNQGDTHFGLSSYWRDHFSRMLARSGKSNPSVKELREWTDSPEAAGLPLTVANLLVLTYADSTNRTFFQHGTSFSDVRLDYLPDNLELREQALPGQTAWDVARKRALTIFRVEVPPYRNAGNVAGLHGQVSRKVDEHWQDAHHLAELIRQHWGDLGGAPEQLPGTDRLRTAHSAVKLLKSLRATAPTTLIEALAAAPIETSPEAMGKSLATSGLVIEALRQTEWDLFRGLSRLDDDRRGAAKAILELVRQDLGFDEQAVAQGFADTLRKQSREAAKLLASVPPVLIGPDDDPPIVKPPVTRKRVTTIGQGEGSDWDAARLGEELEALRRRLEADPGLRISLSWTLFKEERT